MMSELDSFLLDGSRRIFLIPEVASFKKAAGKKLSTVLRHGFSVMLGCAGLAPRNRERRAPLLVGYVMNSESRSLL